MTEQITEDDKEFGRHVGIAIFNFVGPQFPDLEWIEVRNASGSTIET
jgi:hypothetical protein